MQKRLLYCTLILSWLGLTLPDIYYEFQIFPILGSVSLLLMALVALYHHTLHTLSSQTLLLLLALNVLIWSSAFWGTITFGTVNPKGAIGLCLGIMVFALILALRQHIILFQQTLTVVACFHLLAWGYQMYGWLTTGTPPDLLANLGVTSPTRFTASLQGVFLIRLCGLWSEPARYATFIFFVLTIRVIATKRALQCFDILLIISLLSTLSLSGLGMALVFFAWYFSRTSHPLRIIFITCTSMALAAVCLWILQGEAVGIYLSTRLSALADDSSLQARTTSFLTSDTLTLLLGYGIGNYPFVGHTNGFLYLLDQLGWLGSFLWWLLLSVILHLHRFTIWKWLLIAVVLLGAPWWTTPLWWAWLGILAISHNFDQYAYEIFGSPKSNRMRLAQCGA